MYGDKPRGVIVYDAAGCVSVNLMRSDRPTFSVSDKSKGTSEEARSALESYEAYFGAYQVDEAAATVTHHVEGSLFPNWTGSKQVRFYEFKDDYLILSTPAMEYGGSTVVGRLTWRRVPALAIAPDQR